MAIPITPQSMDLVLKELGYVCVPSMYGKNSLFLQFV